MKKPNESGPQKKGINTPAVALLAGTALVAATFGDVGKVLGKGGGNLSGPNPIVEKDSQKHTVEKGETLSGIIKQYYNLGMNDNGYFAVYTSFGMKDGPSELFEGEVLEIPSMGEIKRAFDEYNKGMKDPSEFAVKWELGEKK